MILGPTIIDGKKIVFVAVTLSDKKIKNRYKSATTFITINTWVTTIE
jgi:hypothetical protein